MPYKLKGNCVIRADTGKTMKCYDSRKKALAYLAALEIHAHEAAPLRLPRGSVVRRANEILEHAHHNQLTHGNWARLRLIASPNLRARLGWIKRSPRAYPQGMKTGATIKTRGLLTPKQSYAIRQNAKVVRGMKAYKVASAVNKTAISAGTTGLNAAAEMLGSHASVTQGSAAVAARAASRAIATRKGRAVIGAAAVAGGAYAVTRLNPSARKQLAHSALIKMDRKSRIEWRKEQKIFGRDGSTINPGDEVRIGRGKYTYLGGEQNRQGRLWTTNGRMLVQDGKGHIKSVKYASIRSGGKRSNMSSAAAREMAFLHSQNSWSARLAKKHVKGVGRVVAKHYAFENRSTRQRLRKELRNEIRNLGRRSVFDSDMQAYKKKAAARVLSRAEAQVFSKEMKRKRTYAPRPAAQLRYARQRVAEGRPRPRRGRKPGDLELLKTGYRETRHQYG